MNDFLRILGRVAQYRLARAIFALVVVGLATLVGTGKAHAETIEQAHATCTAQLAGYTDAVCSNNFGAGSTVVSKTCTNHPVDPHSGNPHIWRTVTCSTGQAFNGVYNYQTNNCPHGWDDAAGACAADPAQCLAKNDALSSSISTTKTSTNGCDSGCGMSMGTDYTTSVLTANGITATVFTGKMRYTGASCSTPTAPPEDQTPECLTIEGTSTCKQADGKICHAASANKDLCWRPGETGEKHADDVKQVRNAGNESIPPPLTLLNGDTLTPKPNPVTTTETNGTGPTINTTITNYSTTNGTNAAPDGGDGGADGQGGDGEGDGEGNSGSGGTTCEDPPVTAGDTLLGLIAAQTWHMRCAEEEGNSLETTGLVGDCSTPFTVTGGNEGQVAELTAMRQQACPNNESDFLGDGTGEPEGGLQSVAGTVLPNGLDQSGYGWGSSCPTIPTISVMGNAIDLDTGPLCDWMNLGGFFVLLLASLACLRMLLEA